MSNNAKSDGPHIEAGLGLWDAISIIVGIVVGTSIFRATSAIFDNAGSPATAILLWLAGGALAWCGAVCYAELATSFPRDGGDYEYLNRAFGSWCGFLFAWAQITTIISGNIGIMSYVFADYAGQAWPVLKPHTLALTSGSIVALSALNAVGVVAGKATQNALTATKVIGLGGIVIAAAMTSAPVASRLPAPSVSATPSGTNLGLALVFVLYAYGGWQHAAYVAAEVKDQRRNLPRALTLGIAGITVIYLVVNTGYLHALGFETARLAKTPAADVLEHSCGPWAAKAISTLVMLSALGAINGMILTGTRIYAVWGADYPALKRLSTWNERRAAPIAAIALQAVIALMLVFLVGTTVGQHLFDTALNRIGLSSLPWEKFPGGFEMLVAGSTPVFWVLCLLTGLSVVVLRLAHPDIARPFKVPLYPVPVLVFCATCLYMLKASVDYAGGLTMLGIAPLIVGFFFWLLCRPKATD